MYPFSDFWSFQYWCTSPNKKAQKFYTTLCLYISAVLDFSVGHDLKDSYKLNWSTTASYYSMVHSARMIVFAAIGDYPKDHKPLVEQLFGGKATKNGIRCDFLEKPTNDKDNLKKTDRIKLDELAQHYSENLYLPKSKELFDKMGQIMNNARQLRNDSNYESLLIAHEYNHETVTKCFESLSEEASKGATFCIKVATECFKQYIENDEYLPEDRAVIKYFVKKYMRERVYYPVKYRTRRSVLKIVQECIETLERSHSNESMEVTSDIKIRYAQLEEEVARDKFSNKQRLMSSFEEKIDKLRQSIRSPS